MAVLEIPSISVEYVPVPVTGPSGLTTLPVEMAIVQQGQDPAGGDWKSAEWSDDADSTALVLIGPGTDLELEKGVNYGIWVKITSSPEVPVLGPYPLHIT